MTIRYSFTTSLVSLLLAACSDGGDGAPRGAGGSSAGGSVSISGSAGSGGVSDAGSTSAGGSSGSSVAGRSGGGGGSSGAGANMGGNAGQSSMPAKPVERDGEWALDWGDVTLQVDPARGGRITTFQLGTENLLTGAEVSPLYWGSTLWISPEATLWKQPPPEPIDSDPYVATATDTVLTLTGMPYAELGVRVTKKLSTATARGAFEIEYTLHNVGTEAVKMAPWEVTRVKPRGVTFFPKGPSLSLSTGATFPTTEQNGVVWYTYDASAVTVDSKLYADATEGWLAHAAAGLLFIKSFSDLSVEQIAPKEGDVELYTNQLHTYVELENQGAYVTIPPGESSSWKVTWYLKKLPDGVEAAAGSEALVQLVRDTLAGR